MRAVVVLLLLIANAIVSSSNFNPPEPAPPARTDYALGLLTIVDGGAPAPPPWHSHLGCASSGRLARPFSDSPGETPGARTGEDACATSRL